MSNSDNPRIGAEFQRIVKEWFEKTCKRQNIRPAV